jgi:hypothetical protein
MASVFAGSNQREDELSQLDRRKFLSGAGVLLSVPFFESLSTSAAAKTKAPKRLVIFYCSQGHPYTSIRDPIGTPSSYTLADAFHESVDTKTGQLASNVKDAKSITLADFKSKLTIVTGLDAESANDDSGNPHNLAVGHALVGKKMQPGGGSGNQTLSGGPSIDHLIATRISPQEVAFKAFHASVHDPWEICFTGPAQPVSRLEHPDKIAKWLFGDFMAPGDDGAKKKWLARRQSVIDATKQNIASLRTRLSPSDRLRLDDYLARVQAIEQRLHAQSSGQSCTPLGPFNLKRSPFRDAYLNDVPGFDPWHDPDIACPTVIDCLVEALACDRTRVATLTIGDRYMYPWLRYANPKAELDPSYAGKPYPNAGSSGDWHNDIVHAVWPSTIEKTPPYAQKVLGSFLRRVARWEMAQLAYLLYRLQNEQDEDGPLLDSTLVLYLNEFGKETHDHDDQMYLLAGGGMKGAWHRYQGAPHHRLLLSLLKKFGIDDVKTFGDPKYCEAGPLPELLG